MTLIAVIACLAVLLMMGYFFVCCAVTAGLWLRDRLNDRRSAREYRTA